MKRVLALIAIAILMLTMAACGEKAETPKGDLAAIEAAGKLVVGVTVYEPMNYLNDDGAWDGFDTEFANAVAKKLGVEAQFVIIDWDNKWATLNSKKIDCVWNGMTLSEEAKKNADCTDAYVLNAQVVVMKADKVASYADAASMKDLKFAVEAGSAGKDIANENKFNVTEYATQTDAMSAVKAGKADACVIDITMAKAMTGEGTSFADLGIGISLTEEEYAIACRKDSDLTAKINELMDELTKDGTLPALATKYNLNLAE
ncbi:MAG: transporter substrate-binding domain-containing protein [Clostridia bacterium]|nr:transporter substrate-binding domain-containing protein [Clostridia bacterium]